MTHHYMACYCSQQSILKFSGLNPPSFMTVYISAGWLGLAGWFYFMPKLLGSSASHCTSVGHMGWLCFMCLSSSLAQRFQIRNVLLIVMGMAPDSKLKPTDLGRSVCIWLPHCLFHLGLLNSINHLAKLKVQLEGSGKYSPSSSWEELKSHMSKCVTIRRGEEWG